MSLDNIDAEGWTYSVDFGSLKDENCGSKIKGNIHFVRRRRMVRYQVFNGNQFIPCSYRSIHLSLVCVYSITVRLIVPETRFTCSYCDLEEVARLADLLLEKLAEASAYRHPTKSSDVKSIALKNRMLTTGNPFCPAA